MVSSTELARKKEHVEKILLLCLIVGAISALAELAPAARRQK
jgi:hypothetical protein